MPPEISRLSALSARIIRLAYVSQTILPVKLAPEEFARAVSSSRQHLIREFATGNDRVAAGETEALEGASSRPSMGVLQYSIMS